METSWIHFTLLLVQLPVCFQSVLSNVPRNEVIRSSLCKGEICHISQNQFSQLQEIISSNQLIILNEGEFSVNDRNGFLLIENVSNLTISGGERGSLIQCSPDSSFGLYLKNTTNITLTGITMRGCAFPCNQIQLVQKCIPVHNSRPSPLTETAILLEMPRNVVLSGIHVEYSPGLAIAVIDSSHSCLPRRVFAFMKTEEDVNPDLRLTDCTISHSGEGSVVIHGFIPTVIEDSVITNSRYGIMSTYADIVIKNVNIINCTESCIAWSHVIVSKKLVMITSLFNIDFLNLYIYDCKILFSNSTFYSGENMYAEIMAINSELVFKLSSHFHMDTFGLNTSNSTLTFTGKMDPYWEEPIIIKSGNLKMEDRSSLTIVNSSRSVTVSSIGWILGHDSYVSVTGNSELSIMIWKSNVSFNGAVRIANNTITNGYHIGILHTQYSNVEFNGDLEVVGNSGMSSVITADSSDLSFSNKANFSNNHASNGGALTLTDSIMYVTENATVEFIGNSAQWYGGAIYISKGRENKCSRTIRCSIQFPYVLSFTNCRYMYLLTFIQNRAGIAGNAVYEEYTSACTPYDQTGCEVCQIPDGSEIFHYIGVNDSSDLSNFTSDPTRVCFCENNIPNCYKIMNNITVHPGETFNLSLVIVGYGWGTVPGSVIARDSNVSVSDPENDLLGSESQYSQEIRGIECQSLSYSIVSEGEREQIALAVDLLSFLITFEKAQGMIKHSIVPPLEDIFHIPVFVGVDLLACPVGFQLVRGRCVCHQILLDNNIDTCFISNGTGFILRPAPYWIGLPNDMNSSILIHPHCPFDYCQLQDISITAESVNTQCQYQRSGVLCGSCREGLSMIMGSSECKTCFNVYLVSNAIFILMGVALVTILTLLNMTVSVGTLNGLILFANILQANRTTFLPPNTSHASSFIAFLSAFIAWLNLDVGIPMCFFDGLTTYVKTWLQFVFPLYILALVGVMIIASNYSTRVTRLLGTNAVSVLATLVLLSYTKILRILITAFSFTTLTGSQDYHSVVWLADGNIKYFQPKHTILFLVALLVLLLLGVPYTITLTAAPWIQRSRFKWVSSLYNRFKPLFDAYMGPYKDRHRYWTGMLLLARVVLIILFSSIANTNTVAGPQLNLLLLSLSSVALFGLTAALKPYRKRLLNGLEIFHLMILFIFSSSNLYVSNIGTGTGPRVYIYIVLVGICFLVFLGICVGHVWYRVRKTGTGRRSEPPEREEDEWQPLWHIARVRAEDEDEEEENGENVTIRSTFGAANTISHGGRRESLVELIAENADM